MLPFRVTLRPGESPFRQVVFAVTRAVLSGELVPGYAFPSVRELSQTLKISPGTAHKVVTELTRKGLLEVRPGIGTVVTSGGAASPTERRALLLDRVEELVVEAKRLGLAESDVQEAVASRWSELFGGPAAASRGESK